MKIIPNLSFTFCDDNDEMQTTTMNTSSRTCCTFASCREVTQNEFIVPLRPELKEIYAQEEMGNSMSATHTESVRPLMSMSDIRYIDIHQYLFNIKEEICLS